MSSNHFSSVRDEDSNIRHLLRVRGERPGDDGPAKRRKPIWVKLVRQSIVRDGEGSDGDGGLCGARCLMPRAPPAWRAACTRAAKQASPPLQDPL